ncbi:MAG: hypothetical protein GX117_13305 [Candidatus Hydrogenedentes bacterium]|nr:hypothetical protein [Candidatus Hydrogenedentota bacterium]
MSNKALFHAVNLTRALLLLLLVFHFFANCWWLHVDNHAIQTDEETHMIMARDYYSALFPHEGPRGLGARLRAVAHVKTEVGNPVHPPALHVLGALFSHILGYGVDRMAFVNTLSFLAAIVGVYLIARRFLAPYHALFSAAVFSFTPMVYSASRFFMTDYLSMALIVWVFYTLLRSEGFSNRPWSLLFGVLNAAALLARITSPLYYIFPAFLIFCAGFLKPFFSSSKDNASRRQAQVRVLLHGLLIVVVTLMLAGPWYLAHSRQFYQYWFNPQQGVKGSAISFMNTKPVPTVEKPTAEESATKEAMTASAPAAESSQKPTVDSAAATEKVDTPKSAAPATTPTKIEKGRDWYLPQRVIGWARYPVFVINNGVFLPMFLLALAGMVLIPLLSRFRRQPVPWILLAALLSTYVFLTVLLRFGTPRYALQVLFVFALCSALPIVTLPWRWLRRTAMVLYLAVLLFQYGNLTVCAYGDWSELKLPIIPDQEFQSNYDDLGLYLYKPVLHGSFSYGRMEAPTQDNFKDRLFFAMLKEEQMRPFSGVEAPYARLNIRGMIFDEAHFPSQAKTDSPFQRKDIPEECIPYRQLTHYGWGKKLEDILPVIDLVDYVAYTTEDISEEEEEQWMQSLQDQGFERIDRFHEPRSGMIEERFVGLLARTNTPPLPEVQTVQEATALGLAESYRLRYSAAYSQMTPELCSAVDARLTALIDAAGQSTAVNDQVDFRGFAMHPVSDDHYMLILVFENHERLSNNYRLLLAGIPTTRDGTPLVSGTDNNPQAFQWSFDPTPSLTNWPETGYILIRFPIHTDPLTYRMAFTFYSSEAGAWGKTVDLGLVDFSKFRTQ